MYSYLKEGKILSFFKIVKNLYRKLLDTSPEKNINIDNLIRERNSIHNSNIMVNDLLRFFIKKGNLLKLK